jgi:hypothetical protein
MLKDLVGMDNGYFEVISFLGSTSIANSGKTRRLWECRCKCSKIVFLTTENIRKCIPRSCGCYKQKYVPRANNNNLITHGLAKKGNKHPLYIKWMSMKQRCNNPKNKSYKWYGAKGITLCDEWLNSFMDFYNWCLSNNWESGLTIDRINPKGNYSPENCRLLTHSENSKKKVIKCL